MLLIQGSSFGYTAVKQRKAGQKNVVDTGDGFGKEVDEEEQGRLGNIVDTGLLL